MMLEVGFKGGNIGETIQCQIELEGLAVRLQTEYGDLFTPEECAAAGQSLDALVALVDRELEKDVPAGKISPGPFKPKPTTLG